MQRFLIWLSAGFLLSSCSSTYSEIYPFDLAPQDSLFEQPKNIKILSSKGLKIKDGSGDSIAEISGIAWDADEKLLYGVSDEGTLYHFGLKIVDNAIEQVILLDEFPLLDKNKKALKGKWSDSEGLALKHQRNNKKGDTELVIAFENKPRVLRFSTLGEYIGEVKLPAKLKKRKTYRHKNKALESVAVHPSLGVITAAEFPIKKYDMESQRLYAADGKSWSFRASGAKNSAVTGLEVLPNGNLLVLERAWAGIQHPIVASLTEVILEGCKKDELCPSKNLLKMTTQEGWSLDNFEGLAYFEDDKFFMMSDDNDKIYQSTVLVLFEIGHLDE